MPFIPHTKFEEKEMLDFLNISSIRELFKENAQGLLDAKPKSNLDKSLHDSLSEYDLAKLLQKRASLDSGYLNFIGAGAYEHHIPAAVWELASRGEFATSYTPYQAEASQGNLQLIYEFQTHMSRLTGMDIANASLYDGATATAEAILMAIRSHKKCKTKNILIPESLHPNYIETVKTVVSHQNVNLIKVPFDSDTGIINLSALEQIFKEHKEKDDAILATVIAQPNFFGSLEDVHNITDLSHKYDALVISVVNPTTLALLEAPGHWGNNGADIACGEGQPLGIPLASGGPYFGFICCKTPYVRNIPGRIVGRTTDTGGKDAFVLTLQAREQHIRRSKATSNICTNQGLLMIAATIYLCLLGKQGIKAVAAKSFENTHYLAENLAKINDIDIKFNSDYFHEALIEFKNKSSNFVDELLSKLEKSDKKILAGLNVEKYYPSLPNCLLVCATETKSKEELNLFINEVKKHI